MQFGGIKHLSSVNLALVWKIAGSNQADFDGISSSATGNS
jgi:hypothetical protein